jgi:hypothetical protein
VNLAEHVVMVDQAEPARVQPARRLRKALISQQGVEPGAGLQELHQRLLRDDDRPAVVVSAPRTPVVMTAAAPVPRQLPLAPPSSPAAPARSASSTPMPT